MMERWSGPTRKLLLAPVELAALHVTSRVRSYMPEARMDTYGSKIAII
jgi:hypothetical protein